MTTLSSNKARSFELGDENHLPAVAADIIYEGAAVGDNGSGYVRPLVAGDPFRGFALENCDNSAGSAGDKICKARRYGDILLPISGLAITDVNKDVYASDDDTFTLTKGGNTRIGYVKRWVETGYGIVAFMEANGAEAELTDNSAGTASDTIAAVGGTYVQATMANAIASLTAKVNYLLRRLGN